MNRLILFLTLLIWGIGDAIAVPSTNPEPGITGYGNTHDSSGQNITVADYIRAGFAGGDQRYYLSFNNIFLVSKERKYDFGIGAGVENFGHGTQQINITQVPLFFHQRLYLSKQLVLGFEPGIMIPLSGYYQYDSSGTDKKTDYRESELKPRLFCNFSLGLHLMSDVVLEFNVRNQATGVDFPFDERKWMFGLNIGYRL